MWEGVRCVCSVGGCEVCVQCGRVLYVRTVPACMCMLTLDSEHNVYTCDLTSIILKI